MDLRKYLVMGSQDCKREPTAVLREAAKAGITAFQFREKGEGSLTGQDKLTLGRQLRDICAHHHVLFFVNDDIDLVEPLAADGIHVGQDDRPMEELRERFPDKLIGLSVSNQTEVKKSAIHLADYLGAGPIFATATKPDAKKVTGPEWIRILRQQYPDRPIVGIGGITELNARSVIQAGADGVAVISGITAADNIMTAVRNL